jgi:nicotine blue oxidoreductase
VRTVGLLLAAGAGRRFGGPKALVRPAADAPTLLESAVATLRAAGVGRVVVVVGADACRVTPLAAATGAEVVTATGWAAGMGASLRAGLQHLTEYPAETAADLVLVTLVDLPDVGAEVVRRVLAAARGEGAAALVRAAYGGAPGHPVALGREHWAGVAAAAEGDRGARSYLQGTAHRLVECGDLATGRDVDTPEDLGRG